MRLTHDAEDSDDEDSHPIFPISGPALSQFFLRDAGKNVPSLSLTGYTLDEDQCRAIITSIAKEEENFFELFKCDFTEAGERILLDGMRRNYIPAYLSECNINPRSLADSLRGNENLMALRLEKST